MGGSVARSGGERTQEAGRANTRGEKGSKFYPEKRIDFRIVVELSNNLESFFLRG